MQNRVRRGRWLLVLIVLGAVLTAALMLRRPRPAHRAASPATPPDTRAEPAAQFFIGGEVQRAGAYPLGSGRITVRQAILQAGPIGPPEHLSRIEIYRRTGGGEELIKIDPVRLLAHGEQDEKLVAGDSVMVAK